jgi:hypothetical protein
MKVNYLFTAFSILSVPIHGQGIIDILNSNGLTNFAMALETYPDLLYNITCREDVTVFAPINEAAGFLGPGNDTKRKLFRRDTPPKSNVGTQASYTGNNPPPPATKRDNREHRKHWSLPDSNFLVLNTFLRDPTFVNLGRDQPGRVITNYASPKHGSGEPIIKIKGGLEITKTLNGPFKYDKGIIYAVNE